MAISWGGVITSAKAATWTEAAPATSSGLALNIHDATAKAPIIAADEIPIADSASTFSLKKITLATLKSFILDGRNWLWSGQGGQPPWVWGGSDGTNMYVYNPANFNVNSVGGLTAANLISGGAVKKSNASSNMNDLTQKSGFYYGNAMVGAPDANWWMYINAYGDSWADGNTYGFQIAQQFWSDTIYTRRVNNGVFQPWVPLGGGGVTVLYDTGYFSNAASTTKTFTHNLANAELKTRILVKILNTKNGYTAGEILDMSSLHGFVNDVFLKKGYMVIHSQNSFRFVNPSATAFLEVTAAGATLANALLVTDVQFRVILTT